MNKIPVDVDNDEHPPLACSFDKLSLFNVNACIIVMHNNNNSNNSDILRMQLQLDANDQ